MNWIAAIDLDALLPLIIGAFWLIFQIAGAASKKKPAPPRPANTEDSENEDPLADLFRKLGVVQEFKTPEPPKPAPVDAASPPRPQPIQENTVRTPRLQEKAPPPSLKPENIPKPDMRPSMESFKTAMPSMKLPAMKLSFQGLEKSSGSFPKVGTIINPSDRSTLRRAMLSHVILGKPRGMDDWSGGVTD